MRMFWRLFQTLCNVLILLNCASALKFDLEAHPAGSSRGERCIRNFVAKDTLVVVKANLSGTKGDGMVVNIHVSIKYHLKSK